MERDRIFSHFGRFFGLLPPKKTENQNFEKKQQKTWISFYTTAP